MDHLVYQEWRSIKEGLASQAAICMTSLEDSAWPSINTFDPRTHATVTCQIASYRLERIFEKVPEEFGDLQKDFTNELVEAKRLFEIQAIHGPPGADAVAMILSAYTKFADALEKLWWEELAAREQRAKSSKKA